MDYINCKLYKLQSKKQLREWLGIKNSSFFRFSNLAHNISPLISTKNGKRRLIEVPSPALRQVQANILSFLTRLDYPAYLFSGLKKRDFIGNASQHSVNKYVFKLDISKFFPSISREYVYRFFRTVLETSADVAEILTNCTTTNIIMARYDNADVKESVVDFIKQYNLPIAHLTTGAPTSMLLSYLCNRSMFDEIHLFSSANAWTFSIYVDDITISSNSPIKYELRKQIIQIIKSHGYSVSMKKTKYYTPNKMKTITGVAIDRHGKLRTPNKLLFKAHQKITEYKSKNLSITSWQSLRGTIGVSNRIDGKFSQLIKKMKLDIRDEENNEYKKV